MKVQAAQASPARHVTVEVDASANTVVNRGGGKDGDDDGDDGDDGGGNESGGITLDSPAKSVGLARTLSEKPATRTIAERWNEVLAFEISTLEDVGAIKKTSLEV